MKLPKNLFPPVNLSPEQCAAYEKIADDVVNQALREYDDFNGKRGRQLDRKRWKQIKKNDDVTVFCERASYISSRAPSSSALSASKGSSGSSPWNPPSSVSSRSNSSSVVAAATRGDLAASQVDTASSLDYSESEDDDARATVSTINSPVSKLSAAAVSSIAENEVISTSKKERAALPKILAVGIVPGKVEDMIYGMITPTLTHTFIKSVYINDEIADAKVLQMIKQATPDEPLQFLGLKWMIKAHSAVIGTVVRQRDFVFVESLGMRTRADGSRFGYFVIHSVEVPGIRELKDYSIVRGQLSMVIILTQSSIGHVDVFMKSYVELNGTLPDSIGVRTAANSLASIALTEICGHKRKLGWEVTKRMRNPSLFMSTAAPVETQTKCSNCNKSFSRFSTTLACFFCHMRVCSKCCEQRELTVPNPAARASSSAKLVEAMAVNACKRCYSTVYRNMEAEDVAREEILAGEYGVVPKDYHAKLERKVSSSSSAKGLNLAELQNLTISRKPSANGSMMSSSQRQVFQRQQQQEQQLQHLQQQQQQQQMERDWSDSVIELDRNDFARAGAGGPYQAHPHVPMYQSQPQTGYYEQPTAPYHHQPHMMYYGQAPMGYGVPQPMGYNAPPPPNMGYRSNQPPMGYSAAPHMGYYAQPAPPPQASNEDLYARITKLHQTAEHVYQYTKHTTETALGPNGAPIPRC